MPFATPTTHIVSRGTPKVLIKGRQQVVGVNGLRKAAIMNSIRRKEPVVKRTKNKHPLNSPQWHNVIQMSQAETELEDESHQPPEPDVSDQSHITIFSSLGLSDYDALDEEDDDLYEDEYQDEDDYDSVYSGFNTIEPTDDVSDDYEFSTAPSHSAGIKHPQKIPSEETMDLVARDDRQGPLFFARYGV